MKLLILGGGGHAKVVADVALAQKKYQSLIFVDDQYPQLTNVLGFPVMGALSQLADIVHKEQITEIFIAIGNNKKRMELFGYAKSLGLTMANLIHPSAVVSQFAKLECGILVMPHAAINCAAHIGNAAIINTAAIIEHDCVIADGVHISPNAALAGKVRIGQCSWVGIGSCVKEQISIGQHVVVGAGSVVVKDIQDNQTVVGVPAQPIRKVVKLHSEIKQ